MYSPLFIVNLGNYLMYSHLCVDACLDHVKFVLFYVSSFHIIIGYISSTSRRIKWILLIKNTISEDTFICRSDSMNTCSMSNRSNPTASCLSLIAPVSKQHAVQAEFVHLEEFLPTHPWPVSDEDLSKVYMNSQGEFTLRPPASVGITRLEKWLEAWNLYERTLMCHDASLYNGLATYRDFILKCNKKFHWSAVYTYDQRYRAQLAACHSLEYGSIDKDLYNEVFDCSAVRQDLLRCFRCQSTEHSVKWCPFPRASPRRRRRRHTVASSTDILPQTCNEATTAPFPQPQQPPHDVYSPTTSDLTCQVVHHQPLSSREQTSQITPPALSVCSMLRLQDDRSSHSTCSPAPSSPKDRANKEPLQRIITSLGTSGAAPAPPPPSTLQHVQTTPPPSSQPATFPHSAPVRRLNPAAFQHGLEQHPDRQFVDYIVHACTEGVDIGYQGPRIHLESPNWPSAEKYAVQVQADIDKNVAAGITMGPFPAPPFPAFRGSALGCFPKKRSFGKYRVIHDLSYPPSKGINAFINKEDYHVQYLSLDQVMSAIRQRGQHTQIAKLDLASAFQHIPVRSQDYELLGFTFDRKDPITNATSKEYYYDTVLQFGARSSPKLFNEFATAAKHIMHYRGASYAENYLDDYITMGDAGSDECQRNLDIMIDTCDDLGFTLNPDKVCQPSTVMTYLGIELDTDVFEARITQDRLQEVLSELKEWSTRVTATKRQILSLVGKLQFVSRVVRPGRTFLRRMISLAKQVAHLHHRVRLSVEFQQDVQWWMSFLPSFNGVSFFYEDMWQSNADLHIYTDSSDIAAAGYYSGAWFVVPFAGSFAPLRDMSINWRELFAVVTAAATFGSQWRSKRIMMHCDNMCIVHVLTSGTCKNDQIMELVRKLFYIAATYNFELSACYVNTKDNCVADALSRLQFNRFTTVAPDSPLSMRVPVVVL